MKCVQPIAWNMPPLTVQIKRIMALRPLLRDRDLARALIKTLEHGETGFAVTSTSELDTITLETVKDWMMRERIGPPYSSRLLRHISTRRTLTTAEILAAVDDLIPSGRRP